MISKKIMLKFNKATSNQPIISNLAKTYNLTFNIMSAQIFPRKEGFVIFELTGNETDFQKGTQYLKDNGINIQLIEESIIRDDDKCYHCGFCVAVCPTEALIIDDKKTMKVNLHKDRCIACGYCVGVCPVKAIKLSEFA